MTLTPLRKEQFSCLTSILKQRIDESQMVGRVTPEYVISRLSAAYDIRSGGVYVDDVECPKHVLIMTHFPGGFSSRLVAFINLIYSDPSVRGHDEDVEVLFRTAENYARANGCSSIQGSSWIFRGSKSTESLWLKHNYETQEVIYCKYL